MHRIAGYYTDDANTSTDEMVASAQSMVDAMVHEKSIPSDIWVSEGMGLVLAKCRLAASAEAMQNTQPIHVSNGRFAIVFDGEIYNSSELRREIISNGAMIRGRSCAEVLLSGFEKWGVEQTIRRCVGMFALALWDISDRELYLIRDRMGEKPLYYGWQNGTFLFASELKAIRGHPSCEGVMDRESLALYFRHNYIPAPYSIYKGVYKLQPGTMLRVSLGNTSQTDRHVRTSTATYWSLKEVMESAECGNGDYSPEDVANTLEGLLLNAVRGQIASDLALGAFLSGGIDTSTVVALMQRLSPTPVSTFTLGCEDKAYDEAIYAEQIARHLGCHNTAINVTPRHAKEVIPKIARLYDEPFADSSQIPTFLVSQLASKHVRAILTGDAGDFLFYGSSTYPLLFKRWNIARRVNINNRFFQNMVLKLTQLLFKANKKQLAVVKSLLSSGTYVDLYKAMNSTIPDPCKLVLNSTEGIDIFSNSERLPAISSEENTILALDALSFLPDDILVKVSRAATGCGLETRMPLLDHRVVEYAYTMPFEYKYRDGVSKWPLRQVLYKYVSRDLIERPKKGFSVPLGAWLRNELREWACDLLDRNTIKQDGILNADRVQEYVAEHMEGRQDHKRIMWGILMFQSWLHDE